MGRYVVGVTGASGSIYADRLLMHLKDMGHEVHLVLTETGKKVCAFEGFPGIAARADQVHDNRDFFAPFASGSWRHDGMAILPCSMGSLAKLAHGIGDSLLTRAGDVCLKEKYRLIIVPREAPMSALHLRNQESLALMGAVILPASPAFYHKPATIEDLVDTVLARVLDHLGLPDHPVGKRWREM
jgi:4-hydroxy-3-polyprenylbenzoate decarboxylase